MDIGALCQVQTATIFLPGGASPTDGLAGEVVGVGSDGTTIVITNAQTGTTDLPFTRM